MTAFGPCTIAVLLAVACGRQCILSNTRTVFGRRYEMVTAGGNWVNALTSASNSTCYGTPGHLVTFETSLELELTVAEFQPLIPGPISVGVTDLNSEGSFYFVAGPSTGRTLYQGSAAIDGYYVPFAPGQPTNGARNKLEQGQHCVVLLAGKYYDDVRCSASNNHSYLIEYESALGENKWLPTIRGADSNGTLHSYELDEILRSQPQYVASLVSATKYRQAAAIQSVISSRSEHTLFYGFMGAWGRHLSIGGKRYVTPSPSRYFFAWPHNDGLIKSDLSFWDAGFDGKGGNVINGWYAPFLDSVTTDGVQEPSNSQPQGPEECVSLHYGFYNPSKEGGFGLNDYNCMKLSASVTEYIWACPMLQQSNASSPECKEIDICSFSNLCTAPFVCAPHEQLGYECICPNNTYYDVELDTCISSTRCPSNKHGLLSTESMVVCAACATPSCPADNYETLCSTAQDRVCKNCSTCSLGFTMTSSCSNHLDTVCEDITPPIVVLFGNRSQTLEIGSAYVEQGYIGTDRGNDTSVTVTRPAALELALGWHNIRYTAVDEANLSTTVLRSILVQDTTPPSLTIGPSLELEYSGSHAAWPSFAPAANAYDVYDGNISTKVQLQYVQVNQPSRSRSSSDVMPAERLFIRLGDGNTFRLWQSWQGAPSSKAPPGSEWIIMYNVSDTNNNSVTQNSSVLIKDTTPPTVQLAPALIDLTPPSLNCQDFPTAATLKAACFRKVVDNPTVDSFHQLNLTIIDGNEMIMAESGLVQFQVRLSNQHVVPDFDAQAPVGTQYTVNYLVSDWSGNIVPLSRPFKVSDTLAPAIALQGDRTVTLTQGQPYVDPGAVGYDLRDGFLNATISGTIATLGGNYTLRYTVTDSSGHLAQTTRTIIVLASLTTSSRDSPRALSTMHYYYIAGGVGGFLVLALLVALFRRKRRQARSVSAEFPGPEIYAMPTINPLVESQDGHEAWGSLDAAPTLDAAVTQPNMYDTVNFSNRGSILLIPSEDSLKPNVCKISRPEAETMLAGQAPGTYLARLSSRAQGVALSLVHLDGSIHHYLLKDQSGQIFFNNQALPAKITTVEQGLAYVLGTPSCLPGSEAFSRPATLTEVSEL
eukprot:m.28657 g.28657  ORF g.28657 m.28657 type:complete len:1102 (+) comp11868_c0_seq1:111-3416(+)